MRRGALLILSVVCAQLLMVSGFTAKDFEGGPFSNHPENGLYKIEAGLSPDIPSGLTTIAYGDFNSDKYTDIVVLSDDLQTCTVWVWNSSNASFVPNGKPIVSAGLPIANVIPGDYNYDGKLDLLLVVYNPKGPGLANFMIYFQGDNVVFGKTDSNPNQVITAPIQQPAVFDIDGDKRLDIIYYNKENQRAYASITTNALGANENIVYHLWSELLSSNAGCKSTTSAMGRVFAPVHSISFVDLNGDCRADIFLYSVGGTAQTKYLEIWTKMKDGSLCLVDETVLTRNLSIASFTDFNRDGGLDVIMLEEPQGGPSTVNVFFNQKKLSLSSLCSIPDSEYIVSPFDSNAYNMKANSTKSLQFNLDRNNRHVYAPNDYQPPQIRFGDIDRDGYSDAVIVLTDGNNKVPLLYYNTPCSDCMEGVTRIFTQSPLRVANDETFIQNAEHASFYDFDEHGSLGLLIAKKGNSGVVDSYYNFFNNDTFFLKALTLNGAAPDKYGGIYYGAALECSVTSLEGEAKLVTSAQLTQSAFAPLQLPYSFFGLGRTNNYVENLYIGLPLNGTSSQFWTPIIPNSQLIMNPGGANPTLWNLDVFVSPMKQTVYIIGATVLLLLILGAFIIHLHKKEKEEDERMLEQTWWVA